MVAVFFGGNVMSRGRWVYRGGRAAGKPPAGEKAVITAACEKMIAEVLKPRFLPEIRPSEFNYPIDIFGSWRGNKYRFFQRFRSDHRDAIAPEFDAPFARLEYVAQDHFDLSYHRHTGAWFCLYRSLGLSEALKLIADDPHLHPV